MPNKASDSLTFDAATHTYRIGGVEVPSVTQILAEAGLVDDRWYTDESQLRGRTVHIITALDDRGVLDESLVTGEYQGYLNAWRLFKAETKCEIVENGIERQVCSTAYRFAGTVDRIAGWHMAVHVADVKTGAPAWWHPFQTAAYWMCDGVIAGGARCAIYLAPDGTYKITQHNRNSYDTDVFRAALVLANAKRNEGKTNGRDRNN